MSKRASKKEMELRVADAAELVLQGQAYSLITSHVAEKYSISRRQARRIAADAYLLLKNDIEDDIELIGKGVSGNKVSNLLERYKKDVLSLNPDIVFIYIGINDVWHKYSFGTGTDIIFYENGLRKIIADLKNKGARVILCTPTVIGENKGEFTLVNEFKDIETMEIMNGDLDAYSDVIRKLASELNTDLLDLREIFMNYISENNPNNESSGITTYDGVHLNDLGNKLIADEMLRFIN